MSDCLRFSSSNCSACFPVFAETINDFSDCLVFFVKFRLLLLSKKIFDLQLQVMRKYCKRKKLSSVNHCVPKKKAQKAHDYQNK